MTNHLDDQKNCDQKLLIKPQREQSHYHFFIYNGAPLIPGIIRMRDAPYYLGMNKTFFRDTVQPYLTKIRIDKKGVGFFREELDCWIAYARATLGQPPKNQPPWENSQPPEPNSEISLQYKKPGKKIRVRKSLLRGKPTQQDLENLVNKTLSADS